MPRKPHRRGPGEGNIRQRKDGRWEARISLGFTADNKRLVKSLFAHSYEEVLKKRDDFLLEVRGGLRHGAAPGRGTVGEYLTYWLENSVRPTVSAITYRDYETQVRMHISPELGRVQLAALSGYEVQALVNKLHRAGYARASIDAAVRVLHVALAKARRWGLVTRNAAGEVDLPRMARRAELHVFTLAQARGFLAAIEGSRLRALYITLLSLGLRRGEALGLRWRDVDFEAGLLEIRQTVQRIDRQWVFQDTKTPESERTHELPGILAEALFSHREHQAAERQAAKVWHASDLVFTSKDGGPLAPSSIVNDLEAILSRAKLPHISPHGLRHTIATLLYDEGVGDVEIAKLLGHSGPATTRAVYIHHTERRRKRLAGQVDSILGYQRPEPPEEKVGP